MAVWSASLPQTVLQQGYREQAPQNKLRTQMDAGPPKMRRRYTAGVRQIRAMSNMTTTQIADLKTFHNTTLQGGALAFDWTDPVAGGTVSFRFVTEPSWEPLSGNRYRVSLDLEIMP